MTERRKMARERRRNIAVGLTALSGLVGLVVLLAAFGYVPKLLQDGYHITVYMEDLSGVQRNSRVTLWGTDIGEVQGVGFAEPGSPGKTYAKLLIQSQYTVPVGAQARIEQPLFGGGPVIAFVGSEPGAQTHETDGSAVIDSAKVVDPLAQLEVASAGFTQLNDIWGQVGQNLNVLFGADGDADENSPSLPRVVIGVEQRLKEFERVLVGADAWLGNDQLRDDVSQTAENARKLTETLAQAVSKLQERYLALADAAEQRLSKVDTTLTAAEKTLVTASASVAQIENRYVALADEAAKVVSLIDKLVDRADSKDSAIGLLLSDPQLYQNLADTSERLKMMIGKAELLIEKWQDEGLPIRLFN